MTGWELLVSLLPENHAVGNYTYVPKFRQWKKESAESVSRTDYFTFVEEVHKLVMARLDHEAELWPKFITGPFDDLPDALRSATLNALESVEAEGELRLEIWTSLDKLWRKHREYPDADWSLSELELERLHKVASRFEPSDPVERGLWLFAGDYPDLGERKRSEDYESEIASLRADALLDIWNSGGFVAVLDLAERSGGPWEVGSTLASLGVEVDDRKVTSYLSSETWGTRFASAYLYRRYRDQFPDLLKLADAFPSSPTVQARTLLIAEDLPDAWAAAADLGADVDKIYWSEFYPYGRGADFPLANETAEQLGLHGRPAMGLDVLSHFRSGPNPIETSLIFALFDQLLTGPKDSEIGVLSRYEITELMNHLRSAPDANAEDLAKLEWQLLPALDSDPASSTLQRELANNPAFFVEVLSLVYRSTDEEEGDVNEQKRKLASNAWRLLHDWKVVPGSISDGDAIDSGALSKWIDEARELLAASGRVEVGELQIGQILAQAKSRGEGAWPPKVIRDVLEMKSSGAMLRGFSTATYNSRGITSRGITDGGAQEYALASRFKSWADSIAIESPKTARVLRELADGYVREGQRNDDEAQRINEGYPL